MNTIERLESNVRSYCRAFPAVFAHAENEWLWDDEGKSYLDFFAGAGVLNYGHNNAALKKGLLAYLESNGLVHGLDLATTAKIELLETFERRILAPRRLDYRVMFPGPTGTNAVESALKLARKVTGRTNVIAFTNAFHGMTLGSLAITGNSAKRGGAGVPLGNASRMPYDGYFGEGVDTVEHVERMLRDGSSGIDAPAAIIVETVQAEGGLHTASAAWLRRLSSLAEEVGALLIVDDIQAGCGRTGTFFSFEPAGIRPDVVCLSKSLSGYGLPFALTLMRPELDVWSPGEHNGTFRGNNLAFVTATAAIKTYWCDDGLERRIASKAALVADRLSEIADGHDGERRGRGLIQGVAFPDAAWAREISAEAFERGLVIETSGPDDEVLKLLPPLTIELDSLERGLDIIEECVAVVARRHSGESRSPATDPSRGSRPSPG